MAPSTSSWSRRATSRRSSSARRSVRRTREHLMVKARKGLNAGGKCFGYDNLRVEDRVEYRINEQQAEIVRNVFRRYRDGQGQSTIARALNEEGIAPPRAGQRGTGSWSPAQVR